MTTAIQLLYPTDALRTTTPTVFRHDWDAGTDVSTTVALALDAVTADSADIPPLAASVDADALDDLFAHGRETDMSLEFSHEDYSITVAGDGTVSVREDRR